MGSPPSRASTTSSLCEPAASAQMCALNPASVPCPAVRDQPPAGTDLKGVWRVPPARSGAVGEGGLVGRREPDAAGGTWCWCSPGAAVRDHERGLGHRQQRRLDRRRRRQGAPLHRQRLQHVDVHASGALADVWGSSAQNLFVVGDAGVARHFDGTSWASVDVAASTSCSACGARARPPSGGRQRASARQYEGAEAENLQVDEAARGSSRPASASSAAPPPSTA